MLRIESVGIYGKRRKKVLNLARGKYGRTKVTTNIKWVIYKIKCKRCNMMCIEEKLRKKWEETKINKDDVRVKMRKECDVIYSKKTEHEILWKERNSRTIN